MVNRKPATCFFGQGTGSNKLHKKRLTVNSSWFEEYGGGGEVFSCSWNMGMIKHIGKNGAICTFLWMIFDSTRKTVCIQVRGHDMFDEWNFKIGDIEGVTEWTFVEDESGNEVVQMSVRGFMKFAKVAGRLSGFEFVKCFGVGMIISVLCSDWRIRE